MTNEEKDKLETEVAHYAIEALKKIIDDPSVTNERRLEALKLLIELGWGWN